MEMLQPDVQCMSGKLRISAISSRLGPAYFLGLDNTRTANLRAMSYTGKRLQPGEIRILTLHSGCRGEPILCSTHDVSLEQAAEDGYSALSYTWGPSTQPHRSIRVNDADVRIRQRLYQALEHLRDPGQPRTLWIDALCINQRDAEEKTAQLPLMSHIYSAAAAVEIWLGTAADEGGDDDEWAVHAISSGDGQVQRTSRFLWAVSSIMRRPWFSRVWILQELVLGAPGTVRVRLGRATAPWADFRSALWRNDDLWAEAEHYLLLGFSPQDDERARIEADNSSESFATSNLGKEGLDKPVNVFPGGRFAAIKAKMTSLAVFLPIVELRPESADAEAGGDEGHARRSLAYVLSAARPQFAADPRDKIYGLLGMVDDATRTALRPSYEKSKLDVFRDATVHLLTGCHRADQMLYWYLPNSWPPVDDDDDDASHSGGPSWVLDFSYTADKFVERNLSSTDDGGHFSNNDDDSEAAARQKATPSARFPPSDESVMLVETTIVDTIAHLDTIDLKPMVFTGRPYVGEWPIRSAVRAASRLYDKARALAAEAGWAPSRLKPLWQILAGPRSSLRLTEGFSEAELDQKLDLLGGLGRLHPKEEEDEPQRRQIRRSLPMFDEINDALKVISPESVKTFFVTRHGVCGMCVGRPRVGDVAAVLFRGSSCEVHFVLRPSHGAIATTTAMEAPQEAEKYRMVGVARISDDWVKYCEAAGKLEAETVKII